MNKPVKIALLGVQHYHANFWAKAVQQSPDATVIGIWEPDLPTARAFASEHSIKVAVNRDKLLQECDAVMICSATVDHFIYIRAAVTAGKPILCEKPLGVSTEDGERIQTILKSATAPFMQSFPKRFDPVTTAIRELVSAEELGVIALCRIRHGHSHGLNADFHKAWFVDPQKSGGGTLLDEGIHAADFLRYVFGEPATVTATISSTTLSLAVEDTAVASFLYSNGMIAEVATSWCFAAADDSIELYGTKGTALLSGVDIASRPTRDTGFLRTFHKEQNSWQVSDLTPHFKTGVFHEHVAWAFIKGLQDGGKMPVTAEDGIRAFAMIDAAYKSAQSGERHNIAYPKSKK